MLEFAKNRKSKNNRLKKIFTMSATIVTLQVVYNKLPRKFLTELKIFLQELKTFQSDENNLHKSLLGLPHSLSCTGLKGCFSDEFSSTSICVL